MNKSHVMATYGRFDLTLVEGKGCTVTDDQGKHYLDFVAGVAVNSLGHAHPGLAKAIGDQAKKLIHVSNLYWTEEMTALADKLCQLSDYETVFFSNSGTEAMETALKIARKWGKTEGGTDKHKVLYAKNSFHGRSLGALSITGQKKYQEPFLPLLGGCGDFVFNDEKSLEAAMDQSVCAVVLEPIQGEGGIVPADPFFLKKARALCDENEALLIFDEVQAGIGRTGTLFAYQGTTVVPDVLCLAKGLGGGFPIGATLARGQAATALTPGDHGCTFGGNSLASVAGLTVLQTIEDEGLLKRVNEMGALLKAGLEMRTKKYPTWKAVRGEGLMLGLVLEEDPKALVLKALEKGLLLVGAGKDVVRFVPPLIVTEKEIEQALFILDACMEG